jgi:hypothetical protein
MALAMIVILVFFLGGEVICVQTASAISCSVLISCRVFGRTFKKVAKKNHWENPVEHLSRL